MNHLTYNTFFSEHYDSFYKQKKNYEGESFTIIQIFKTFGLTHKKKILDIGCGTGEHALHIAKNGYHIKGIDISEEMIKQAQQKTVHLSDQIFFCQNITTFSESFDFAYSLFHVINCLKDEADLKLFLKSVAHILPTGGIYIFDCWNTETILLIPPHRICDTITTPEKIFQRSVSPRLFKNRLVCFLKYVYTFNQKKESITHRIKLFQRKTIEEILSLVGLKILSIVGPLKENDIPKQDDRTITFIVQKI